MTKALRGLNEKCHTNCRGWQFKAVTIKLQRLTIFKIVKSGRRFQVLVLEKSKWNLPKVQIWWFEDQISLSYWLLWPIWLYIPFQSIKLEQFLIFSAFSIQSSDLLHGLHHKLLYTSDTFLGFLLAGRTSHGKHKSGIREIFQPEDPPPPQYHILARGSYLIIPQVHYADIVQRVVCVLQAGHWRLTEMVRDVFACLALINPPILANSALLVHSNSWES